MAEMGLRFMRASSYATFFEPSTAVAEALVSQVLQHGAGFVAVVDGAVVGMLGAIALPWLGVGPIFATEICWWVEPEYRNRPRVAIGLLDAFEAWARERGAVVMQMTAPNESVASIYVRREYACAELSYLKAVAA